MSTPPPADPNLTTTPASGGPGFDENLRTFWAKNSTAIYVFCALVLLTIVGREGWQAMASKKEEKLGSEYAAANTPEKLRAFAKENSAVELGGVGYLSLADDEYSAGKYNEAATDYEAATGILKEPLLSGRAKLGKAMSNLAAGQAEKGRTQLQQLADDSSQLKTFRSEATYHLASLALDAGQNDEVKKLVDSLMKLDASGVWAQRGMMLQAKAVTALPNASSPPQNNLQIQLPSAK